MKVSKTKKRFDDVVGLDIGASEIKVAVVRDEQVINIGRMPLPSGTIVDGVILKPGALSATLKRLWRKTSIRSRKVNFSLANNKMMFRRVSIPRSENPNDLHLAITTNAESWFMPMRVNDIVIDFFEGGPRSGRAINLELAAADKQMINSYIKVLRRAHLTPIGAQYGPLASCKALALPRSLTATHAVIDIGLEKTSFTVVNGQDVLFSRLIDIGGNDFTEAIVERTSIPIKEAQKIKHSYGLDLQGGEEIELVAVAQEALLSTADKLVSALTEMRLAFEHSDHALPIHGVTLIGGGSHLSGLAEQIHLFLGLPIRSLEAQANFDAVSDLGLYAGAISLSWQKQMSLIPAPTISGSNSSLRPKVNRRLAKRLSKQMRRKNAQANPMLVSVAIGFMLFLFMNLYGRHLSSSSASSIQGANTTGILNYSNPTPNELRVGQIVGAMLPSQMFSALSSINKQYKISQSSFSLTPGTSINVAPSIIYSGAVGSQSEFDAVEQALSNSGMSVKSYLPPTNTSEGVKFQFGLSVKQ